MQSKASRGQKGGLECQHCIGENMQSAKKTAEEAAEKQKACQKQGKIQTAWQDVISEAKRTPKRLAKQGFQRPKGRV